MEATEADRPLGYAEILLRGMDGANAVTTKTYTYADLSKIVGRLPVGLMFEVHLCCNGVRVGSGLYLRHNSHVEPQEESGACVNLFQGIELPANPDSIFPSDTECSL